MDDECPWCVSMRKGPCGREFAVWQKCVKDVKGEYERRAASSLSSLSMSSAQRAAAEEAESASLCFDYFRRLHVCIHANVRHKEYYRSLVQLRQTDEEVDDLDVDEDDYDENDDDD